jgi:hypothetical protein
VQRPAARRRAVTLGLILALAVAAACASDSAGPPRTDPTVPTAPPQTTTALYAVPPVIDAEYVNRVLEGLDQAQGEVIRLIVRTRTIPREAFERLKTMYADRDFLNLSLDLFSRELHGGLVGYRTNPGNARTVVTSMISAKPSCLFAQVTRDASALSVNPEPVRTLWVALVPLDPTNDPFGYNPTGWGFAYEGFQPGRLAPPDPCAAF